MDELDFRLLKTQDIRSFDDDGTTYTERVWVFKLGKYGPFTERQRLDKYDPTYLHTCVNKLRTELQNLPR